MYLQTTVAIFLLASFSDAYHGSTPVAEAFVKAKIVPEVIAAPPAEILEVKFETSEAYLGNIIYPHKTLNPPHLRYKTEPGSFYTFMLIDPDVPSAENPYWRSYLMALYVNIVDLDTFLQSGTALSPYVPPSPIPGTSKHRYILLLYKQAGILDTTYSDLLYFRDNLRFSADGFAKKYHLGDPVAGNYFVSEFPDRSDKCYI